SDQAGQYLLERRRVGTEASLEEPELDRHVPLDRAAIMGDGRQGPIQVGEQRSPIRGGDIRNFLGRESSSDRSERRRVMHLKAHPRRDRPASWSSRNTKNESPYALA